LLTRTAAEVDDWLAARTARARGKLAQLVAARNATAVEVSENNNNNNNSSNNATAVEVIGTSFSWAKNGLRIGH